MACAKLDIALPFVRVCALDKPGAAPIAPPKAHCDAPPVVAVSAFAHANCDFGTPHPSCRSATGLRRAERRDSYSADSETCLGVNCGVFVWLVLFVRRVSTLALCDLRERTCCSNEAGRSGESERWREGKEMRGL